MLTYIPVSFLFSFNFRVRVRVKIGLGLGWVLGLGLGFGIGNLIGGAAGIVDPSITKPLLNSEALIKCELLHYIQNYFDKSLDEWRFMGAIL